MCVCVCIKLLQGDEPERKEHKPISEKRKENRYISTYSKKDSVQPTTCMYNPHFLSCSFIINLPIKIQIYNISNFYNSQ